MRGRLCRASQCDAMEWDRCAAMPPCGLVLVALVLKCCLREESESDCRCGAKRAQREVVKERGAVRSGEARCAQSSGRARCGGQSASCQNGEDRRDLT